MAFRGFFVAFSWLFRGPRFGQILRVLALEQSSFLERMFRHARVRVYRRRTNVQQLTCNIDLSCSCCYFFFSFVLIELEPLVLKGKSPGGKILKKNVKSVKNSETILPFSCCP